MSMKFAGRDFKKNPLKREDTQIHFDPNNEEEKGFCAQQHHNEGGRLDSAAIVARYFATGVITHTRDGTARYIDATAVTDFRTAMTSKVKADQMYNMLPQEVRNSFSDQEEFVKFVLDEANLPKLREWGLANPLKTTEPEKPMQVVVVNPEAPKAEEQPA